MTANRKRAITPAARTAFRTASAGLTGLATFGAVAATGWVAAVAARDYDQHQAAKAADAAATARRAAAERAAWLKAHPVVRVVQHRRPHRTIVSVVRATAPAGTVAPGPGGTITRTQTPVRPATGQVTSSGGGHATSTHPAAPAPPPPPPPPPPAPSSGS